MRLSFDLVRTWPQAMQLREVRNTCRAYMTGSQKQISHEEQQRFFERKVETDAIRCYLLTSDEEPIGYGTLSPAPAAEWLSVWATWGLVPAYRKRGLGPTVAGLVTQIAYWRPEVRVRAEIFESNAASKRTATAVGYCLDHHVERHERRVGVWHHISATNLG